MNAIEKHNKRVTYEWDEFMRKYGERYDDLTEEGKRAADSLAEAQGERWVKLMDRMKCG